MLKQRIVTALVLVAVLALILFAAPLCWFDGFMLLVVATAAWEWGRLNTPTVVLQWLCVLLTLLACAALVLVDTAFLNGLWLVATGLWLLGVAALLRAGVGNWPRLPAALRLLIGVALLSLAWLAAVQWRAAGVNALLSVLALVWAADVGAYAAGRTWGRRKLAPAISPGKSWEGVLGGFVLVAVIAVSWLWLDGRMTFDSSSIYTRLHASGIVWMMLAIAFLVALSIAGDLFESLVKRSAGVKDSSGLLPGHGGVLDRIDALLPVLPVAWWLAGLIQGASA